MAERQLPEAVVKMTIRIPVSQHAGVGKHLEEIAWTWQKYFSFQINQTCTALDFAEAHHEKLPSLDGRRRQRQT